MPDAFEKMDKMYRHQRYFYDITRKYYLLGRDRLINEMVLEPGNCVLEIGCGTGRNLAILSRRNPDSQFFGIDASKAMLETARKKIEAAGCVNIGLKNVLAGEFTFRETFGLEKSFDVIFFSYSISMIPDWKTAVLNALENLKPGGLIYIVDFFDQRNLPRLFRAVLKVWLRQFDVRFPKKLIPHMEELERSGAGKINLQPIYKSYAFLAEFKKSNSPLIP